ncbi:MAG: family 16 glycoside hydrolase [Limisphaerales bacterium]
MTHLSKIFLLSLFGILFLFSHSELISEERSSGFKPLFNGKNFSGWVPVNTAPSTWLIKDNMLICSGKPIGELRTERMYQNFIMEVEWRHMKPKGNAGIFVWADDITARGQPFHRGIEVQVLENSYGNTKGYTTHGDIFPIHGATMTPVNGRGGSRAFPVENRSRPSPDWNHYRIVCNDGNISLAVNGKVVTKGKNSNPRKGYICIESEGGVVHYRNMIIKELPNTPVKPEQIAIMDRGYRCLYSGVDFSGWKATNGWRSHDWQFRFHGSKDEVDTSLESEELFGDYGFIFDVRVSDETKPLKFQLRGKDISAIQVAPDMYKGDLVLKGRNWNRFVGELRGNHLTLSLNDKKIFDGKKIEGLPLKGPIRIVPTGPISMANIYVRPLDKR